MVRKFFKFIQLQRENIGINYSYTSNSMTRILFRHPSRDVVKTSSGKTKTKTIALKTNTKTSTGKTKTTADKTKTKTVNSNQK